MAQGFPKEYKGKMNVGIDEQNFPKDYKGKLKSEIGEQNRPITPVPADAPGTDWKEIASDIYNKLATAGKEVKKQAGKLWGKITDIATIDTPTPEQKKEEPLPSTPEPKKETPESGFPPCVVGNDTIEGIPNRSMDNGRITFKHLNEKTNETVRYYLDKNGGYTTDTGKVGRYYCDGATLSLEQEDVQDELESTKEKILSYNTGKLPVFYGEYNEMNIDLLQDVTDTLVTLINKHHCGSYFRTFRNLLVVLKKYCTLSRRPIDRENLTDITTLLTDLDNAITNNKTNTLVNEAGLDWNLLKNPIEDMENWVSKDISKNIGATTTINVYIYKGQNNTRQDVQKVDVNIKALLGKTTFDCDTDGVRWVEILALLNDVDDFIDKPTQPELKGKTVTTASYSESQLKGMKEVVVRCSTSHKYNKKYDKVLAELSYKGVFKDQLSTKMRESKNDKLTSVIRKTLIEAKETKKNLIQESKIVKLRFDILLESKPKNKKQLNDLFINILTEMIYLHKQGFDEKLIAENASSVFNILGTLFGGTTNNVLEMFKSKGVKYILEQLGIGDNTTFKNYMTTALENTELKDVPKLFTDCDFLTKKISISIPDSYLKQIDDAKEMGNEFLSIVGDTLQSVVRDSDFNERLESRIQRVVCPLVDRMSEKFGNKLNSMKTSLVTQPINTQL